MDRRGFCVVVAVTVMLLMATAAIASPVFVAQAKNLRGALYLGVGPTPYHASEMAVAKCSQDSVIPCTCKVVGVRMECPPAPPPMMMAPQQTKYRKVKPMAVGHQPHPPVYQWGRPMQ